MKKMFSFLKPYKKECVIAPSFKMLEAIFELIVPLIIAHIIDEGIALSRKAVVFKAGGILLLLYFIGLTCSLTAQFFAARAAVGFAKGVRAGLYEKILSFSHENIDAEGTSSLITRMTGDISQVQNGLNMTLRLLLRSPFIVFGAMIMAFTVNAGAALIFVVVIPVLFFVVFLITLKTIPRYKKIQSSLDSLTGHIRENLSGVRVVRTFSAGNIEKRDFNDNNDKMYAMSVATSRLAAILNPATLIVVNVAMLVLIYNGAVLVDGGILTGGQVYALVNYMSQILVELVKLSNLVILLNKAMASGARIENTLNVTSSLEDKGTVDAAELDSAENLVEFKHVSFAYPTSGEDFLSDVSFDIKKGEHIGIIGGTGSGKSTVLNLLMRFYDVTAGSVLFKGSDIKDLTLSSLRKSISVVPQKARLFSGTLRENLLFANPEASEEEMNLAIDLSESRDVVNSKGKGLDFHIREGGANLSGGQKQRLTIARAIVKKADLYALDDSSSALDYATDARLRENLKKLTGKTVIIVSQRIISVKNCDRIIVMDDGKIAGIGTHDELLAGCEVYREICESQNTEEEGSL
ncbi:MAG: ABC transporter ATP-binding protein/permease [Lachnospiraceae bacterium]|nr:ABC transporter ATP-binding protein/permease [Lachnospiraceae bacterium]